MSTPATTAAIVIGRFPVCLHAHTAMIERALAEASQAFVVVRAAYHPRIPRDPFTWEERVQMIVDSLPAQLRDRHLGFMPARDYSDPRRWIRHVRETTDLMEDITPIGRTRLFVEKSPAWKCPRVEDWEPGGVVDADEHDASSLLAMILQAASVPGRRDAIDEALAHAEVQVAPPVFERLREWTREPHFEALAAEQKALDEARAEWRGAPYEPIFTTVDCVVQCAGQVLLVKRRHAPGRGLWALPGGFVEPRESLRDGAIRELLEETAVALDADALDAALRDVRVFDQPDRSQRGRSITHAHLFYLGEGEPPAVLGSDDAAEARWIALAQLPDLEEQLFEDHFQILDDFLGISR
ncbi:MAG TPA: NUDIX domain-containing protein [Usitatibacter sp.]|jgi:bifunctional NMN adenylyltransferase/nudix hydrolase|nr:NUDIX domain-containing protein [Usitatibacter sp.]